MGTLWKQAKNGHVPTTYECKDWNAVILAERPDYVRYPEELRSLVGGTDRGKVTAASTMDIPCPMCKSRSDKAVLLTEHDLVVIACEACRQYVWARGK